MVKHQHQNDVEPSLWTVKEPSTAAPTAQLRTGGDVREPWRASGPGSEGCRDCQENVRFITAY